MSEPPQRSDVELIHQFKNYLSIIVGFSGLLLEGFEPSDQRHLDLIEIQKAANGALALVPELSKRIA
jgi:hypothetical protein